MRQSDFFSSISARSARERAGRAATDGAWQLLARATSLLPFSRPERHGVELLADVPYRSGGSRDHLLDVYRPRDPSGPSPVVLYVHGGGFRILSKESHRLMSLAYARRGCVVFNINYRLAPRHPYPAAVEDACAALVWASRNAARFGGDPGRIVLAGESAGANLVTSLAVVTAYPRPEPWARAVWDEPIRVRAVVPACGLLQVSDSERFVRRKPQLPAFIRDRLVEVERAYLGRAAAEGPARDLADPLLVLERGEPPARPLPPFFAFAGTKDPVLDDTRRLARALERLGVPCEARYYPGEIHAFHAFLWRPNARACWAQTHAFVDRYAGSAASCAGHHDGRRQDVQP